jgi:hypothetical protein
MTTTPFLLLLLLLQSSHQFTLFCNFSTHSNYIDVFYTCTGTNVLTFYEDRTVTEIVGDHIEGRTNNDVTQFFVKFQNCHYMPLGLDKFFPNLESVYIMKSNLQHLLLGDLDGLNKLRALDVSHNPVEELSADFFKGHDKIESLSFFDSHIKKVERGAFDMLKNLEFIDFDYNQCYSEKIRGYEMQSSVPDLYDKCDGRGVIVKTHEPEICESFETKLSLWIKLGFGVIIFLMVLTTVLGVALFRIYSRNANKNWHEMDAPMVVEETERNCE